MRAPLPRSTPLLEHAPKAFAPSPRSGRSEGTAEVIFANRVDAERAMKRYNNVQLDGQPMAVRPALRRSGCPALLCAGGVWGGRPRLLSWARGYHHLLASLHSLSGSPQRAFGPLALAPVSKCGPDHSMAPPLCVQLELIEQATEGGRASGGAGGRVLSSGLRWAVHAAAAAACGAVLCCGISWRAFCVLAVVCCP